MLGLMVIAFVSAASAGIVHDGSCPDLKPVENFNITAYQGVWYEVSKFPSETEKDAKCHSSEYKVEGDVIKIKNSHVLKGVQKVAEGSAKIAPDANNAAKLLITMKIGEQNQEFPVSIVATDYSRYAIAFSCKLDDKKKSHEDCVWVLSREKKLEGEAKTTVDNFLKEKAKELDAAKLVPTDFSEAACKFDSTSPVAAPAKQ